MKLIAATNNQKKLLEIQRILEPMGYTVLSLKEAGLSIEVEETADSFSGNARLKAMAVYERTGLPTVADDSGLCVDALDGAPGVYSARFGGEGLDDRGRYLLLLEKLSGIQNRGARFVSAVCCVLGENQLLECEGTCEGEIATEPFGEGGFGYDPVFLVDGVSYAMLSPEEKDKISHRGRALERLRGLLL